MIAPMGGLVLPSNTGLILARPSAVRAVKDWQGAISINSIPGELYPSSALVDACYTLLLAPKSAALK